jgi:hypothetical protein
MSVFPKMALPVGQVNLVFGIQQSAMAYCATISFISKVM